MNGMPTMHLIAAGVTGLYGLISLTGGVMGYAKGSLVSLLAGGGAGVLLVLCALGISRWPIPSLVVALVVALLLVGRFTHSLLTKGSEMTSVLHTISLVMIIAGVAVLICAALALMAQPRPPAS
jgi:uncharacterized membrane protein (UPF0136 family)